MNKTNDDLWLSFEALAKTYPHDNGVRMTADLARWLLEEGRRIQLPTPAVMVKVVGKLSEKLNNPAPSPSRDGPLTADWQRD